MTHDLLKILPATEWAWDGCKEDYNARANVWRECTEEFFEHTLCEMPPMDWRGDPYRFLCMETYSHRDDLEWYLAIVRIDDRCFCRILPRCRFDEMAKELVAVLKCERKVIVGKDNLTYRGYQITYDPPPIGSRACDWQFSADGYDGAVDSKDNRCGSGPTIENCIEQIDEILLDQEANNANR